MIYADEFYDADEILRDDYDDLLETDDEVEVDEIDFNSLLRRGFEELDYEVEDSL